MSALSPIGKRTIPHPDVDRFQNKVRGKPDEEKENPWPDQHQNQHDPAENEKGQSRSRLDHADFDAGLAKDFLSLHLVFPLLCSGTDQRLDGESFSCLLDSRRRLASGDSALAGCFIDRILLGNVELLLVSKVGLPCCLGKLAAPL